MTRTIDERIPQASLREQWSVSSVQRLAWTMGRPATEPAAASTGAAAGVPAAVTRLHDPVRRARRLEALRRLAADPHATPAERRLAATRLADHQRAC